MEILDISDDHQAMVVAMICSSENRKNLLKDGEGICFHCLRKINIFRIKQWEDDGQTAICPYCEKDSIVPTGVIEIKVIDDYGQYHNYKTMFTMKDLKRAKGELTSIESFGI